MAKGYKEPESNEDDEDEEEMEENMGGEKKKANHAPLPDEDREALAFARNSYIEHKNKLIEQITSNSAMKEKDLSSMDVKTLEVIANGVSVGEPDYSARGFSANDRKGADNSHMIEAMKVKNLSDIVANKGGK